MSRTAQAGGTFASCYGRGARATLEGKERYPAPSPLSPPGLLRETAMPGHSIDHAGLETLSFDTCLQLLASVPVGRVGFLAAGEVQVLPVNHLVDGQDVIFRTAHGSKLYATQGQKPTTFEADDYDEENRHPRWSVVRPTAGAERGAPREAEAGLAWLVLPSRRGQQCWSGSPGSGFADVVTGRRPLQATRGCGQLMGLLSVVQ